MKKNCFFKVIKINVILFRCKLIAFFVALIIVFFVCKQYDLKNLSFKIPFTRLGAIPYSFPSELLIYYYS